MTQATPAGKLAVRVTFLGMGKPPAHPPVPAPREKLALTKAERPTLSFYRFLFRAVGEPWLWADRLRMSDAALTARLHDPRTAVHVLHEAGVPAGFAELYAHDEAMVEIVYFGLMPEFIGRGLGPYLLDRVVRAAWALGPQRVTVETCTLDHPYALATYHRAGFITDRQMDVFRDDPRVLGLVPMDAAPTVPVAEGVSRSA